MTQRRFRGVVKLDNNYHVCFYPNVMVFHSIFYTYPQSLDRNVLKIVQT